MPINLDAIGYEVTPVVAKWSSKDTMLYALAVGCGAAERQFCTENSQGVLQRTLPTFAGVVHDVATECLSKLGNFPAGGVLHGVERHTYQRELPPSGCALIRGGVTDVFDKGSAALIWIWTSASDVNDGSALYRREMGVFVRGFGGWGGKRGPKFDGISCSDRSVDLTVVLETRPEQALLYRLTGDRNPLHSDPAIAKESGFESPILHGMCTFGFTGRGLLHALCGSDPGRLLHIEGRFSLPTWPGDSLEIAVWNVGAGEARFKTVGSRGVVIDQGLCRFRA